MIAILTRLYEWWKALTTWRRAIARKGRHYARNIERVSQHYSPLTAQLRSSIRGEATAQPFHWNGPTHPRRTLRIAPYVQ